MQPRLVSVAVTVEFGSLLKDYGGAVIILTWANLFNRLFCYPTWDFPEGCSGAAEALTAGSTSSGFY